MRRGSGLEAGEYVSVKARRKKLARRHKGSSEHLPERPGLGKGEGPELATGTV